MSDAKYLKEQAERCFRLAQQTADRALREKLLLLGNEFEKKAAELEPPKAQSDQDC